MAGPPSNAGWRHPFHSRERVNFPDFSPIFSRHVTPESQRGFHWSIDHIAKLKPADIATDPFTLVKTNGVSPESDEERQQKASERFFSQCSILPSPWTAGYSKGNVGRMAGVIPQASLTPVHTKKVTFSPHPPSLAYISSNSLESEMKDGAQVDVATQTALTIPLTYNLGDIFGPVCVYDEGDGTAGGARDLANNSLRRRLFGQPSVIVEGDEEEEEGERGGDRQMTCGETGPARVQMCSSGDRHLSSTPLKPHNHHHQHTSHRTFSPHLPPHTLPRNTSSIPITSSLVLSPGEDLPEFSPIGGGGSEGGVVSANSEACKRFVTPDKQAMFNPPITPSPLLPSTCPPFSPILHHHPGEGVESESGDRVTGTAPPSATPLPPVTHHTTGTTGGHSPNKATSTPYRHDLRRQLVDCRSESPRGTPTHAETEDRPTSSTGRVGVEEGGRGGGERETRDRSDSGSSDDLPQPISMADLQTFEDDLTSVTGVTTCTSYFTQLATDDAGLGQAHCEGQPLHSTVAVPPNSTWNPSITSMELHQGAARLRLPSIREFSRINAPSMNATDSGVAASSDFNQHTGTSLTTSGGHSEGVPNSTNYEAPTGLKNNKPPGKDPKRDNACDNEITGHQGQIVNEIDSGLVPSPNQLHGENRWGQDTEHGLSSRPPRLSTGKIDPKPLPVSNTRITPSRYSNIQLYRSKLGVPLAITQKSIPGNNRTLLRNDHILPSQLPTFTSPGLPSSHRAHPHHTPSRHTRVGESLTSPIFPEEVIRKKEMLKTQLHFYSPMRSRSPLSTNGPLVSTFPAPLLPFTAVPYSPLPPPNLLPLSPMSRAAMFP